MFTEYYNIMEKEDVVTDGGGKHTPDDFEDTGNGTVTTTRMIREGDKDIPVVYEFGSDGELIDYTIDATEDEIGDDIITKAEKAIADVGKTAGQTYRDRQLQKEAIKEVPTLKAQLAEAQENIRSLQKAVASKSDDGMTDEEAKKYFGEDSVDDVETLMHNNYAKWINGNAKFMASKVTPTAVQPAYVPPKPTVADRPHRTAPRSVPDGTGAGVTIKPSKTPVDEQVNNLIIFGGTNKK
jgi:hypothetical protein